MGGAGLNIDHGFYRRHFHPQLLGDLAVILLGKTGVAPLGR